MPHSVRAGAPTTGAQRPAILLPAFKCPTVGQCFDIEATRDVDGWMIRIPEIGQGSPAPVAAAAVELAAPGMHRTLDRHPDRLCLRQHRDRLTDLHLLAEVYLERDLTAMVTKNAHHHDGCFAAFAALTMATCVGYYFGRRAGVDARQPGKKRTSRIAFGGGGRPIWLAPGRSAPYSAAITTRAHGRDVRTENPCAT